MRNQLALACNKACPTEQVFNNFQISQAGIRVKHSQFSDLCEDKLLMAERKLYSSSLQDICPNTKTYMSVTYLDKQ